MKGLDGIFRENHVYAGGSVMIGIDVSVNFPYSLMEDFLHALAFTATRMDLTVTIMTFDYNVRHTYGSFGPGTHSEIPRIVVTRGSGSDLRDLLLRVEQKRHDQVFVFTDGMFVAPEEPGVYIRYLVPDKNHFKGLPELECFGSKVYLLGDDETDHHRLPV